MDNTPTTRTIVPSAIGVGVARVNGELHAMLTLDDDETGGTLDIIVNKAALGEIMAHADDVRRRLNDPVAP